MEKRLRKGFPQAYEHLCLRKDDGKHQETRVYEISQIPYEGIETCSKTKLQAVDHIR